MFGWQFGGVDVRHPHSAQDPAVSGQLDVVWGCGIRWNMVEVFMGSPLLMYLQRPNISRALSVEHFKLRLEWLDYQLHWATDALYKMWLPARRIWMQLAICQTEAADTVATLILTLCEGMLRLARENRTRKGGNQQTNKDHESKYWDDSVQAVCILKHADDSMALQSPEVWVCILRWPARNLSGPCRAPLIPSPRVAWKPADWHALRLKV